MFGFTAIDENELVASVSIVNREQLELWSAA